MKKIRIIADPYLFSLTMTGFIGAWGIVVIVIISTSKDIYIINGQFTESTRAFYWGILIVSALIITMTAFIVNTRWTNVLVLDRENIELRSCFKKPVAYEYREFPYIYRASYRHNLVGAPDLGPVIVYIVLSRRRLTDFEKTHINQVNSTTDLIKIKFNQKRYRLLLENMPPKLSRELERTFARFL